MQDNDMRMEGRLLIHRECIVYFLLIGGTLYLIPLLKLMCICVNHKLGHSLSVKSGVRNRALESSSQSEAQKQ